MFHPHWKFLLAVLGICGLTVVSSTAIEAAPQVSSATADMQPVTTDGHGKTPVPKSPAETDEHSGHHQKYSLWADLPFWSLIAFIGFILAIKGLGLWDLLVNSMTSREQAETEAISFAESDLQSAQASLRSSKGRLEALDEQIRETLTEAARDAQSTRNDILSVGEKEARAAVSRAEFEIDRVRDQSLSEIFETVANRVTSATEQRLRSGLQAADHDRLIGTVLEDLAIR